VSSICAATRAGHATTTSASISAKSAPIEL